MKKIAYLVAPLMVMPFLIGCNKVKTHKVQSVLSTGQSLKFSTIKGKELKGSAFNHKQNFKFKVETANEAGLTIDPNGIGIYVGKDAIMPLLDGYTVEYTNKEKTAATVTVFANKVTDDIYIDSIAAREGNYIYCVPLMLGVQMPEGKKTLDWHEKGSALSLEFENTTKGKVTDEPDANCFIYSNDAENFYYADSETSGTWYSDHISFTDATASTRTKVTVKAGYDSDYLLIAARSGYNDTFLDAFSWDEINEISQTGIAPYLFNLGETKKVKFKTTSDVEVEHIVKIIGFNHDIDATTGATVGITFQFSTAISDAAGKPIGILWNSDQEATAADFTKATINTTLKSTVLPILPEDLRNNIKTVNKHVGQYISKKWTAETPYSTELFPLADIEVAEDPKDYDYDEIDFVKGEGVTYAYYKTVASGQLHNLRKVTGTDGKGYATWLRSPNNYGYKGIANYFDEDGYLVNGATVNAHTYALAPAFCI